MRNNQSWLAGFQRGVVFEIQQHWWYHIAPLLEGMSIEGSLLTADIELAKPQSEQLPETEITYHVSSCTKAEARAEEVHI
jgi:hypothetical protein